MLADEDFIAMVILLSTANSYKFVGKYGLYHIRRANGSFFLTDEIQMSVRELYLTDVAIDFMKKRMNIRNLSPI